MSYLFEEPFLVDSAKMASRLGASATPIEQALADTLETYRSPVGVGQRVG
jgi:hypothetical protein